MSGQNSRIRQDEVHTVGDGIDDGLDPRDHDVDARDLKDTNDYFASQFRKLTGEDNWETPPAKTIKEIVAGAQVGLKAGVLIPHDFSGNPKRATVVFATPFPNTDFSITLAAEGANGKSFVPVYESKTVAGFVVNLSTNNLADLAAVGWHAVPNGEI